MTLEKTLAKYGLDSYYNAKTNKIKFAYNKVPMTLCYAVSRFVEQNRKMVAGYYTGERYIIVTLK